MTVAAPGVSFLDLADNTALDHLDRAAVDAFGVNLDTHLGDQLLLGGKFGQGAGFIDVVSQRFLAIDMESLLHGAHSHHGMAVIGSSDRDAIQVFFLFQRSR